MIAFYCATGTSSARALPRWLMQARNEQPRGMPRARGSRQYIDKYAELIDGHEPRRRSCRAGHLVNERSPWRPGGNHATDMITESTIEQAPSALAGSTFRAGIT